MADEFQATGIIGGNWWNMISSRTSSLGPSPCSAALSSDHMGAYGWSVTTTGDAVMTMDIKQQARSSTTSDDNDDDRSASGCDNSLAMGFQDSSLQMFGFGLSSSSPTSDWNHQTSNFISHGGGRSGSNYNSMLQDDMINLKLQNYEHHDQIQTDWNSKHFAAISDDSTIIACHGLPTTNSYNIYPSSIVQSLYEPDDHEAQPQQSIFDSYHSASANFRTTSSNDFLPSWPNSSPPSFIKPSTQRANHFLYSNNNTPYAINNNVRASFIPLQNTQFHNSSFEEKPNCVNLTNNKRNNELHVSTTKKPSNEPAFKRSRVETPSPLPTFKVRKEKLGDRITALQQLVSPFGKTDTASVLHEAIEYIKFLHDQVSMLSTPYMKNGTQNIQHQQTSSQKIKDSEGCKQDLRSRGLCLVPISSTYPVANETTPDFWTPTFGGTFSNAKIANEEKEECWAIIYKQRMVQAIAKD